jgi:hypothetical protein
MSDIFRQGTALQVAKKQTRMSSRAQRGICFSSGHGFSLAITATNMCGFSR